MSGKSVVFVTQVAFRRLFDVLKCDHDVLSCESIENCFVIDKIVDDLNSSVSKLFIGPDELAGPRLPNVFSMIFFLTVNSM